MAAIAEYPIEVTGSVHQSGHAFSDGSQKSGFKFIDIFVEPKDKKTSEYSVKSSDLYPTLKMIPLIAGAPSGRPENLLFGAIFDPRLRVRKAIPLGVSVEEGHVVVTWDAADEFAYGKTTGEALDEFSKTISELYFDLNDQTVPLGKDLARVRDILNEYIESTR